MKWFVYTAQSCLTPPTSQKGSYYLGKGTEYTPGGQALFIRQGKFQTYGGYTWTWSTGWTYGYLVDTGTSKQGY